MPRNKLDQAVPEKRRWFFETAAPATVLAAPEPGRMTLAQGQGEDTQDVQTAGQKLLQAEGDTCVRVA